MACPNCDHTMQQVSGPMIEAGNRVFWCPRCGTIKDADGKSTPMLVSRVVRLAAHFGADDDTVVPMMRSLGIIKSITLPGQR
jgi:transposase